ncbi:hypothetical protein NFI96_013241, partial [Prochilodus magdalenae]
SPDRRFSDLKRCADEECSMLLCRGKAAKDFSGPDCRFLSFKKGETIYVYYKLSGQRSDVWAGSVGSSFGYFPKDYLNINHIYTEKEFEVPAEETDFVCFDTGLDTFESYDIDLLLSNSLLLKESDSQSEKPEETAHSQDPAIPAEDVEASLKDSPKDTGDGDMETNSNLLLKENEPEEPDETEDVSLSEPVRATPPTQPPLESTVPDAADKESYATGSISKSGQIRADDAKDVTDKPGALEKREYVTEVEALPELKTTLGTTFDAVTSDDEETRSVTPYFEEDESDTPVDQANKQVEERPEELELLIAAEELPYFENTHDQPESKEDAVEKTEVTEATKGDTWSSLGDTVFKIVSGGERTVSPEDTENDSEEEEDEEEEEVEDEEEDTEKESEDLLHVQDSETIEDDADRTKHSSRNSTPEDRDMEADAMEQSSNNSTTESLTSSKDAKGGEKLYSDVDTITENSVLSKDTKTGEERNSDVDTITENPTSTKDSKASETQHSNIESMTEEPISQNDKDTPLIEKDFKTLKYENQVEEVESNVKLELTKKSSDLDKTSTDAIVKADTPKSNLKEDKPVEKDAEKTIQEETVPESLQIHKLEGLSTDSTSQLDENETDKVKNDAANLVEATLEAEQHKSKVQEKDEQIDRVKEEIVNLLDNTLKAEQQEANEEPEVYEENEEVEELLEDENAVLSTKTEEKEELTENSQPELENSDVVPKDKSPTQTNDNMKSDMESSLDSSGKTNDAQSGDGDGADETQQGPESLDFSVSLSGKVSDTQSGDGDGADETQPGLTSLDSLVSPSDKVNDTQSGDGDGADETQPGLASLDSLVSPSGKVNDTQSGDGDGADETQPGLASLDSLVSPSGKVNDAQSGDGDGDAADETQQGQVSSDSSVSPSHKVNDVQAGDGVGDGDGPEETQQGSITSKEPEYSDSVLRLTLLRDHFKDNEMERIQKYFDLKDLFKIEAMFSELEHELKSAREAKSETSDDIERTLESILEVSENSILDEIEKMLDAREQKNLGQQTDPALFDEEAAILDDFQELAFYLRQKYSAVSDSVPLVGESQSDFETDSLNASIEVDDVVKTIPVPAAEATEAPEVHEEADQLSSVNTESDESQSQDMGLKEDGGHFNKNNDIRGSFKDAEEVQRGPQAILENPLDIPLSFEMDQSSAGSLESPSEFYDSKAHDDQAISSASDQVWGWLVLSSEVLGVYAETLIATLPEEWQPGPTFHGLPWKPVVVTAAVGILTILMFIWRTILAVRLTEKQLAERIQQLVNEKSDVLLKITELNNMIKEHEEKLKNSEKSRNSTQQKFEGLKASLGTTITFGVRYQDLLTQKEELTVNISQLGQKVVETQEENKTLNGKIQVLLDEAKLREDALKAQVLSFEKDNGALKEQKKSLLRDAKDWQEKHEKLSEEIKVYHKTQKELEDSLVHKENEIDVLSCCIAELKGLEVCEGAELQSSDAKLANGEPADKKGDPIKLRLKQMMDVSRIKATLSVIEDERNRYLENFLAEQKTRQALEEQFQKVIHDQTNLKNEKTHLESQYKNLQQRLEITTELYQQKENALQQKLTQEELERREKETKLSEVDGRALQAEEELNGLRQKVKDMQEEMQQNERALKAEIAVQEKKAHENWLKARASERALIEERRESANLRQKIVECSDKMSDLEHALYKSGPPDRHMPPRHRGDSYGPSPVSGGAPSPPLMIEGPGRPPSAPVGRRSEPFGPRPPSDPHGRFSDLGHPLPSRPELFAPRTSSPCAQDGSHTVPAEAKTEATTQASTDTTESFQLSKSQSQGSFLPSPIRDSPSQPSNAPPKAYGPPSMVAPLPPPSNGPLPSMIRPPNGHPLMIPPGPPLGPDPRLKPPHMESYGPPLRPFGPVPPPFVRGPPLRDLPPMGPPPYNTHDFPPDFPGPHSLPFPPRPFRPGPLPPPGAMVPPPFGTRDIRGPTPPIAQCSRDGEMMQTAGHDADGPPPQGNPQGTATSAMAEP